MRLSFDDEESFMEAAGSLRFNPPTSSDPNINSMPPHPEERIEDICLDDPPSDPTRNTLQRMGSTSSMPPQEKDEDICFNCFNGPPSDPNTLRRVRSSSSVLPQEKGEDT